MNKKLLLKKYRVRAVGDGPKYKAGANTGEDAVVFYVKKKRKGKIGKSLLKLTGKFIPETIEGKKTDVVELKKEIRELTIFNRDEYRPIKAGTSLCCAYLTACDSGIPVWKNGNLHAWVNRHCQERINTVEPIKGDPILQPSLFDGGSLEEHQVGEVLEWYPVTDPDNMELDSGLNLLYKEMIPETLSGKYTPKICDPKPGEVFWNDSRTTGYSEFEVRAIDVAARVRRRDGKIVTGVGMIFTEPKLQGGDSSSVAFKKDTNEVGMQGWAGSSEVSVFQPARRAKEYHGFSLTKKEDEENQKEKWIALGWWTQFNRDKIDIKFNARIRKGPGLSHEQIGTAFAGEKVELANKKLEEGDNYLWGKILKS